ncbi:Hypothetical predicted protein [Olea europaea subsp. europaea]|uniref:Uncharacterized protein n=1 Tax=Olea europaea subsp. europaea TaxID=158383 RepID=A0A8S0SJ22_OLEEU|nr:Hypothetical predicted protein [Olea europaea subsp. europaea]
MAGNNGQKKSSSCCISLFNIFKGKRPRGRRAAEDTTPPDSLKGIKKEASDYSSSTEQKWKNEVGPTVEQNVEEHNKTATLNSSEDDKLLKMLITSSLQM